jgi:hypothetical protein
VFFNPTAVTTFQTDTITGTPHITKVTGADGKEIDLSVAGFAVAILGCIAQYSGALTTVGAQLSGPGTILGNGLRKPVIFGKQSGGRIQIE